LGSGVAETAAWRLQVFLGDDDRVAPTELHSGRPQQGADGLGIPPLLADQLAGVIRRRADGESRAVLSCGGLDREEFGPVNQGTSELLAP
jgi:hypothetical protein